MVMAETYELLPNNPGLARPLFENDDDYLRFRESFTDTVVPEQEEWMKARRRSEEEARQRLLR
jgi:hypothetical protein